MAAPFLTYNGVRVSFGGSNLSYGDPLNPLGLPPYTVRVKLKSGYTPSAPTGVTCTLVDATENIWDYYKNSNTFQNLFNSQTRLIEVLGANTTGVTNMSGMFYNCTALTTVPLFDTSSVITMANMFYNCTSVASGALALYQQASTQTNPPTYYTGAFYSCGSNTQTGAAELAQIPSSWGGNGE